MTSKVRLISAQGPAQLLNVLAILRYQSQSEAIDDWEDHLVLGSFCTENSNETTRLMIEACIEISKSWKFRSIKYLNFQDLSFNISFSDTVKRVSKKLNLEDVQSIYVCRNWQAFNEILLETYRNSSKICYGDGFGVLDLNDDSCQPKPFNPKGYAKIDKTYLFMPIEADSKGKAFSLAGEIIQPPIEYLVKSINENVSNLSKYIESINYINEKEITLVTTSNFTESGCIRRINKFELALSCPRLVPKTALLKLLKLTNKFLSLLRFYILAKYILFLADDINNTLNLIYCEAEVDMYLQQIERISKKNELIVVKSHPRETLNQSRRLCDKLLEKGYQAMVIDRSFSHFPTELFLSHINFSKVISLNSFSTISARLLLKISDDQIYPFIDESIGRKYLSRAYLGDGSHKKYYLELYHQAKTGKFSPIRKYGA